MAQLSDIAGTGLGLKRELMQPLKQHHGLALLEHLQFVEIAPENWIAAGGRYAADLRWFAERYPMVCHGLCLSLGGPDPLNVGFLQQVKQFLADFEIPLYSEHLSYCSDSANGYIYDLLPIPFTEEAVHHVAQRIRQTQDILGQRIAVENASFYVAAPISEMDESSFINAVLSEADCNLHLDINNVYVNSVNFGFDACSFIDQMPAERIVYGHIAGHLQVASDLLVDTHGAAVIDPVWQLLAYAYQKLGVFPTLLERDTHIPPLAELMQEVDTIQRMQQQAIQSSPHSVNRVA
ncbi:HvfB family MNIO-type RiPP peptide maturase [Methylophilus sp.]|uniref:HvfB family MNIO-type RiPP peptide maturase n=1 Tax=Methylophilus sp. TaxID=29541 RepID=UPI0040358A44